jgi:glycolate oxidase iron-sulfur subunit
MKLGQWVRPLLPASLKAKVPVAQRAGAFPARTQARRMILLEGCVQPAMAPNINTSTARVLDALGIEVLRPAAAGCCGAIRYHLNDQDGGLDDARRNIDAWWPLIEAGAEAIVMNASGCGQQVKEYDHLLGRDPAYAAKAERVSALTKDLAEILPALGGELKRKLGTGVSGKVVFHPPCTLQHGLKVKGAVEALLTSLGATVAPVGESHFCCGSAGTYSVLQPELSIQLRDRRLGHLQLPGPEAILSANIGCITHLQSGTETPVMHWIEWLDKRLNAQ